MPLSCPRWMAFRALAQNHYQVASANDTWVESNESVRRLLHWHAYMKTQYSLADNFQA